LKFRHTVGDQVVSEFDNGSALPPQDQLVVANVTTSLVTQGQIDTHVYMLIATWQEGLMSGPGGLGDAVM
jgi:hypothetical protein